MTPEAARLYNDACARQAAGAFAEAAAGFVKMLTLVPGYADAQFNLACALDAAGNIDGAVAAYRSLLESHPEELEGGVNLGNLLLRIGRTADAVDVFGQTHTRFPAHDGVLQNLVFAQRQQRLEHLAATEAAGQHRRILLACMPKSGSTFLAQLLANLPGMHRAHLVPDYDRREQELCVEQMTGYAGLDWVAQHHVAANRSVFDLCDAFGVHQVALHRNLFDVMASLRDHLNNHSLEWSMAVVDLDFRSLDKDRQYRFIAQLMVPWLIKFYASWHAAPAVHHVHYQRLIADPVAVVTEIADFAGLGVGAAEIAETVRSTGNQPTFNKGGSGRGADVPAEIRALVTEMTGFYPKIDFSPVLG